MVPNGWVEGKVKSLVKSLDAGVSVNSEDDGNLNSEFKILKTSCVSGDSFDSTKVKSVVKQNEIERLKEPVLSDSIIISRMNTPALVGANGYVEHEITNIYLPDRLWQLKPHKDKVCMRWLGYWFASSPTRHKLGSIATGTSGSMKNITKADVLNISINIPPLPEQQKIAKILTAWDKAIDTTERLIDNSKQQKKALMQQLLTGKKRLLNENGKRFEGDWGKETLKILGKVFIGLVTTMTKSYVDDGIPLIRNSDIKPNHITKEKMLSLCEEFANKHENRKLREGDVVTVHTGEVGVSAVIDRELDGCIGFATLNTRPDIKKLNPHFLSWYFNSEYFINWCVSMSTGDGRQNLNLKDFVKAEIPLPSLNEQKKIVSVLTNADKEIELLEQQLADLQQEKKALMQVLLTGKKRVVVDG
jgi:type I restriction enzyme S subunit